jgi:site-specific DNA recombinase
VTQVSGTHRCRYPREYALASHVRHPGNVYLREADLLPAIDRWLLVIFAPHRLEQTIREMHGSQDPGPGTARLAPLAEDTQALIADCDARLARYQAALDAGADPQAVAEWTRQVKSERAAALARDATQNRHPAVRQLTEDDIRALITGLGDLRNIIHDAAPAVKQPSTSSSGSKSPTCPDKIKSGPT